MNAYICSKNDVYNGINFINSFLDNDLLVNKYDVIIHENMLERDMGFSSYSSHKTNMFNLNERLKNNNIKLYIILSSVPHKLYDVYNHSNIQLISLPFFHIYIMLTECGIETWDEYNKSYKNSLNNNGFSNLLLSLNRRPHYHRCIMMDYLAKYKISESISYTWSTDEPIIGNYKFKWWTPSINMFSMDSDVYNCKDVLHGNPAFHLVTESQVDKISFSEKVFKPLLSGIPFLVFGAHGFHKKLQEYGFELYDEIFNYSFDLIFDDNNRAMGIAQNFSKLKNKNYQEIVHSIYNKVERNRNHALDIFYNKKFIPNELNEIFTKFIKPNKDTHNVVYTRIDDYLN